MQHQISALVIAFFLVIGTAAAQMGLTGESLFNTGPFPCDGNWRTDTWTNPGRTTYELRYVRQWHGQLPGTQADWNSQVRRISDNTLVTIFQQDRYAEPNGIIHADIAYPVPIYILPGDGLELHYWCNGNPAVDIKGHVMVQFWWTER